MIRPSGPLIPSNSNNSSSRSTFIKTSNIQASSITTSVLNTTNFTSTDITSDGLIINNDPDIYFVETCKIANFNPNPSSALYTIINSSAIAGDGNTMALGCRNTTRSGCAFIYTKTNGTWSQQGSNLIGTGSVSSGNGSQGYSVALSSDGTTLAVGGFSDDSYTGAVWIFVRNTAGSWSQQGSKLVGTGNTGASYQGNSVSLSSDGNTLVSGGIFDDSDIGAVWVFTRTGSTWTQQGSKLVGTGNTGAPNQGTSVSLSYDSNTLAIGGPGDDSSTGATWIFTRTDGVWTQQGSKLVGTTSLTNQQQGYSVSLNEDGSTLAIGSTGVSQGRTFIFTRSDGTWTQQGSALVGTGYVGASRQGLSISLDANGNTLVVGAPYDDTDNGAFWIFSRSGTVWTQLGSKVTASGYLSSDSIYFGNHVSITSDGTRIIVSTLSNINIFANVYDLKSTILTSIESTESYISNLTANNVNVNSTLSVPNLNVTNLLHSRNLLYGYRIGTIDQSLTNNTATVLASYWDEGSSDNVYLTYDSGIYTINQNCYILVTVSMVFASNATGTRTCYISKNNTTPYYGYASVPAVTDDVTGLSCSSIIQCESGSTIRVYAKQTSGSGLTMAIDPIGVFSVIYLSNPF